MIRLGYDSAAPVPDPPRWQVFGYYLGGLTPHAWTAADIAAQPARWGAGLWVAPGPAATDADGRADAAAAVARAGELDVPAGATIWFDTEEWVIPAYLAAAVAECEAAGRRAGNYGSLDAMLSMPLPPGGRWSAHWTDMPKLDQVPGVRATQYASAAMLGTDYDASVWALHGAGLWDRAATGAVPWADAAVHDLIRAANLADAARKLVQRHA